MESKQGRHHGHKHQPQLQRYFSEEAISPYIPKSPKDFKSNIPFPQVVTKLHALNLKDKKAKGSPDSPHLPPSVQQQQANSEEDVVGRPMRSNSRKLPHYTIFDDKSEFNQKGSRRRLRCNSVGELNQVAEDRKEGDHSERELLKLNRFVDNNEFNHMRVPDRQVHEQANMSSVKYLQNFEVIKQTQEPKEVLHEQKTALQNQIQNLVVDQVDRMQKRKSHIEQQEKQTQHKDIETIEEENQQQGMEKFQKAKDKMAEERETMIKIVRHDPCVPDMAGTSLQMENLEPFAEAIKEQPTEQTEK